MKKWLAGLLLFSSIVLLTLSIYSLMGMYLEEKKDNQTYETIRNIYEKPTRTEPFQEEKGNPIEAVDEGLLALHGENPDCIAWLSIEGTVIDYPVMYRPQDKNYYLKRDFYGEWSANGDHATASAHGHQTWEAFIADDNGNREVEVTQTHEINRMDVTLTNHDLDALLLLRYVEDCLLWCFRKGVNC